MRPASPLTALPCSSGGTFPALRQVADILPEPGWGPEVRLMHLATGPSLCFYFSIVPMKPFILKPYCYL